MTVKTRNIGLTISLSALLATAALAQVSPRQDNEPATSVQLAQTSHDVSGSEASQPDNRTSPPKRVDIATPQIILSASETESRADTIDQIDLSASGPDYTIDQAEGGTDRCDPEVGNVQNCSDLRERIRLDGRLFRQPEPEVEFAEAIEGQNDPSGIDPVDAANRIGRNQTAGSQVAQAIGQDLLTAEEDVPRDDDVLLPDELELPPDFFGDLGGLPSPSVTRGE